MKKKNFISIFFIFLLTIAIIFIIYITKPKPLKVKPVKPIVKVKVIKIKRKNFRDIYRCGCDMKPLYKANVRSQVSGEVVFVSKKFEVGGKVKKGDVVLKIDSTKYFHNYKSTQYKLNQLSNALKELQVELKKNGVLTDIAKNNYETSKRELKRNKFLLDKGVISESQYDNLLLKLKTYESNFKNLNLNKKEIMLKIEETKNQIESVKNQLLVLKKDLENCKVKAPFNGAISSKNVNLGDVVNINSPLFTIVYRKKLKAIFFVPQYIRNEIVKGEHIKLISKENGKIFKGKVDYISENADEKNRMFQITCVVNNENKIKLLPGTFIEAEIPLKLYKNILYIPLEAIKDGGVFIVKNKIAKFKEIKTGKIFRNFAEVKSGLKEGDVVIVDGVDLVKDGTFVEIEGILK